MPFHRHDGMFLRAAATTKLADAPEARSLGVLVEVVWMQPGCETMMQSRGVDENLKGALVAGVAANKVSDAPRAPSA